MNFTAIDDESGLREVKVFVDNNEAASKTYACDLLTGFGAGNDSLEMAKRFKPCPQNVQAESFDIDTRKYGDGQHTLKVCAVDFGSWTPYWGVGPDSCRSTPIQIDNTAPAPAEQAEATPCSGS